MFQVDKNLFPSPTISNPAVVAPEPFSLESLVAWLETMPADDEYCYLENGECLIAQYLTRVCGFSRPNVGDRHFSDLGAARVDKRAMPLGWNSIAQGTFETPDRTFGAALLRARQYQSAVRS